MNTAPKKLTWIRSVYDTLNLDDLLAGLLWKLKPSKRKALIKQALRLVLKNNKQRIRQQQNVDGSSYTPRKPRKNKTKKKMLIGFIPHLKILEATANQGKAGIIKKSLGLATIHHHGLTDKQGQEMPERQLMGLSDQDKEIVMDLFINAVFANES